MPLDELVDLQIDESDRILSVQGLTPLTSPIPRPGCHPGRGTLFFQSAKPRWPGLLSLENCLFACLLLCRYERRQRLGYGWAWSRR